MSILNQMLDLRWNAPRNCRVTEFRLTHQQADELAHELVDTYYGLHGSRCHAELIEMIKDGTARMWDIPVTLKSGSVTG